jgi:hypothetical protein
MVGSTNASQRSWLLELQEPWACRSRNLEGESPDRLDGRNWIRKPDLETVYGILHGVWKARGLHMAETMTDAHPYQQKQIRV